MRFIERTSDLDTCLDLRARVFVAEQGVPEDEERDALDADAVHFLAWDGEHPVGTARIVVHGDKGKIGRVCVLRDQRGTGLGADLIEACLSYLSAQPGITRAVLGAQVDAIGFYERLGFGITGGVFDDAGIPHQMMERPL